MRYTPQSPKTLLAGMTLNPSQSRYVVDQPRGFNSARSTENLETVTVTRSDGTEVAVQRWSPAPKGRTWLVPVEGPREFIEASGKWTDASYREV